MCMSVVYVCAVYEHMYVVAPYACPSVLISVYMWFLLSVCLFVIVSHVVHWPQLAR